MRSRLEEAKRKEKVRWFKRISFSRLIGTHSFSGNRRRRSLDRDGEEDSVLLMLKYVKEVNSRILPAILTRQFVQNQDREGYRVHISGQYS